MQNNVTEPKQPWRNHVAFLDDYGNYETVDEYDTPMLAKAAAERIAAKIRAAIINEARIIEVSVLRDGKPVYRIKI